jgi:sodium-independent sulfate anion transporter 11
MSSTEVFKDIGVGIPIIALLGLVETIAIGKAFARKNDYTIDANQELLAIGVSNILGSFISAYPVTGSFSRTAVNSHSGVMTPAGGVWTAVLVLLALSFLTPLFYYIPDAALAAVIIMAVIDMVDFSLIPKLWRIKKNRFSTMDCNVHLVSIYWHRVGHYYRCCNIVAATAIHVVFT